MKHDCVAARIGNDKAHGAVNIANIHQPGNDGSADPGCNPTGHVSSYQHLPLGLARVLAHGVVPPLAHILDMRCGPLLALSQNRDSATRISLC
jgi:hypothetical protein